MTYASLRKMFEEEVCVCTACLDYPVGSAQINKNHLQESVLATRYLGTSLRSVDTSHDLFNDRPLSKYKVTPLVRLEDDWMRAQAASY